ncbi:MAG: hypothetical protein K6G43_03220 [Lachnospiraceae bacterium]|nr:hypothetical protein [Lachnospiraceae bacterium]
MTKVSPESQLGTAPVTVEDTEEMFWLRQNDDLQSKITLGNLLSSQYRYREAISIWNKASEDHPSERSLYLRIGAAYLTLFEFEASDNAFEKYIDLGGAESDILYPLGMSHYLKGEYEKASGYFERIPPCGDEMLIAVIYWHLLCDIRLGGELSFLKHYHSDMDAGHHGAYKLVVSVLAGEKDPDEALSEITTETGDLDYCIAGYGLYCILKSRGIEDTVLMEKILSRKEVWPSVSYLAAWNDKKGFNKNE